MKAILILDGDEREREGNRLGSRNRLLEVAVELPDDADVAEVQRALLSTALLLQPKKPQPVLVPAGSVVLPGPGSKI